jgi:hypothetical protein
MVCKWSEYTKDFEDCVKNSASIKFIFSADWSTLYTVGDVNITLFLDEGKIDGDVMSFNAVTDGEETCMVFVDARTHTLKLLFKESGDVMLVTYFI